MQFRSLELVLQPLRGSEMRKIHRIDGISLYQTVQRRVSSFLHQPRDTNREGFPHLV